MERMNKKSFVFSMDAFFAIVLFLIVTLGIYAYFVSFYSLQQQWYMSEDIMNVLSNTKMSEIDRVSGIYPNITELQTSGFLNEELTIAEQIQKLFADGATEYGEGIASDLIDPIRGSRFGVTIIFEDLADSSKSVVAYNQTGAESRLGTATSMRYITQK